jgi:XTP/dITP diphosphohydrolase
MNVDFATSNPHKVSEANSVGKLFNVGFTQIKVPYPEIRADDVSDVAEEGAKYVFSKVNTPVIVEDTGLYIDALKGFPGAYSSFVYKRIGNDGIVKLLENSENRSAKFISVVGYCDSEGVKLFKGTSEGTITQKPRGVAGFGYDSIFIPDGETETYAEDPIRKNEISHRREAFEKFCEWVAKR